MQKIEILGRNVGYIRANGETPPIYISHRNKTKHYFREHEGYGISTSILRLLKDSNIQKIIIIEENENQEKRKLETTTDKYYEKGIHHNNKGDQQIILPIIYFKWD